MWLKSYSGVRYTFEEPTPDSPLGHGVNTFFYSIYHKNSQKTIENRYVYILGGHNEAAKLAEDWNQSANGEWTVHPIRVVTS